MTQITLDTTIQKEHMSRLKKLMTTLEEDPKSCEFREPVPWKELGLTDYPQIIKKPMDISSCRRKLAKNRYSTYGALFTDIQLIWDNCKSYNIPGSDIHSLAVDMEKSAKKIVSDVKNDLQIVKFIKETTNLGKRKNNNNPEDKTNTASTTPKKTGKNQAQPVVEEEEKETTQPQDKNNNNDSSDQQEEDVQVQQQFESASNQQHDEGEVTFEMKVKFTEKVRKLTNTGLTRLVTRVKELCKDALEDVDADKLHIQVDKIDNDSFYRLAELVDDCIGKLINETTPTKNNNNQTNNATVGAANKIVSNKRQRQE